MATNWRDDPASSRATQPISEKVRKGTLIPAGNLEGKGVVKSPKPEERTEWNDIKSRASSTVANFRNDTHPSKPEQHGPQTHKKKTGRGSVNVKKTRAIADDLPVTPEADWAIRYSDLKNENMVHSGMLGASASEGRAKSRRDQMKPHTK